MSLMSCKCGVGGAGGVVGVGFDLIILDAFYLVDLSVLRMDGNTPVSRREMIGGNCIILDNLLFRSNQNAKLFFRFQKLPPKITEISYLSKEKIEKFGV